MNEERSDGKILAGTSASTKRLTEAAQRADVRIQSERNERRKWQNIAGNGTLLR